MYKESRVMSDHKCNLLYETQSAYNQLEWYTNSRGLVHEHLVRKSFKTDPLRLNLIAFQDHSQAYIIRAGNNKGLHQHIGNSRNFQHNRGNI